ncbi:PEP-CTERM sorting domain-containing protein [Pontiella sulfatireligans]|nr:PEP-CTERM sorting domain-containing protein [Pontiella sulfatireligans]
MKKSKTIGLAMSIAVLGLAGTSMAANIWSATVVGNWTNAANWSTGLPVPADAKIVNGNGAAVTIDSNIGAFAGNFQMGNKTGGDTLNVLAGGGASFEQFRIADVAGSLSTVNVTGGSLTNVSGNGAVGYSGLGIVNLSAGSFVNTVDLDLGRNAGSRGEVYVTGGSLSVGKDLMIASYQDPANSGHFEISGGAADIVGDFTVGMYGTGTALLSGGSVTANRVRVGGTAQGGTGTLTVDASGLLTVDQFNVGGLAGATGVANLNGGTIDAGSISIGANGTLNWNAAATLVGTNMNFLADGLLVWEGDRTSDVASGVLDGTFDGSGGLVDIATLAFGVDYDQALSTTEGFLLSKYDSLNDTTDVWTVIPEPATLGLVVAMGAGMLFIRRMFKA